MTHGMVDSKTMFGRGRWRRRLRVWRPWLIATVAVGAAAFAVWVVIFSSWLGLRSMEVVGTRAVASSDVAAAARVAPGTPLARVDLDAVEARVESLPEIANATVRRGWPHTIVITVSERQAVAAVHRDGSWWVMDRTGVLFRRTVSPDPAEPIVEVEAGPASQTLRQVAAMLAAIPDDLAEQTRRVTASSVDSIVVHLRDGTEVTWGSAAASAQKAAVLHALMDGAASTYDVSVPSQPAVGR